MSSPGPNDGPFQKFLRWLSEDPEIAARKYEEIRKRIVRFFVHKSCEDPDALFDKTIDRVVRIVDRGDQYSEPIGLCFGVAHNVWREYIKVRQPESLDGKDFPSHVPDDDIRLREQKHRCLEDCLGRLPEAEQKIIRKYHEGDGREKINTRKQLAAEHGGSNSLRIKVFRIHGKLHVCITDCMRQAAN